MSHIPSPKERLLASKAVISAHLAIIESPAFDALAEAALLELQAALVYQSDPDAGFNGAAAAHLQMTGALEYLRMFRSLSTPPPVPEKRPVSANLDHRT